MSLFCGPGYSILVYVPWVFKKMCSCCCWVECSMNVYYTLLVDGGVDFFYIFANFLIVLWVVDRAMLKFPTITVDLPNSHFGCTISCCIYFAALLSGAYTLGINLFEYCTSLSLITYCTLKSNLSYINISISAFL